MTRASTHTNGKPAGRRPDRFFVVAPLLLPLAAGLLYLAAMLAYGRGLLAFPFDYDQGEGFELYDALRLARGQNIYLDNAQFPFYASNYPPVYRLMLAPLVWLFGPQIWIGRLVTLICALAIGVVVFLAARRQWRAADGGLLGLGIAALAGLSFYAANYVYEIAPLARAHLPMVLFACAGVYALDGAFDGDQRRGARASAGVVLLMIAGFTKLQAIDALAAGFAFLLIRAPRWGARALAISAAATGALVLALNAASGGQFWLNVVAANVNEYDLQQTFTVYGQWFALQGVLIVCSLLYVAWDALRAARARSLQPVTIWSLYFLAGAGMGMLTGKWGAGPAYLIASIAASGVCTAGLLARLAARLSPRAGAPLVALLAAALFLGQAALNLHLPTSGRLFGTLARMIGADRLPSSYPPYPYYDSIGYTQLGHLVDEADTANGWRMVQAIRAADGPVWSEEAMLTLLAGKDVVTNPTQLYNLGKAGMLDTRVMIRMLDEKRFGAVVFRAQFYPREVLDAIGRNYHWPAAPVRMNGFDYWLLLPNP